jgi:hypothetical protein
MVGSFDHGYLPKKPSLFSCLLDCFIECQHYVAPGWIVQCCHDCLGSGYGNIFLVCFFPLQHGDIVKHPHGKITYPTQEEEE